MEAHLEHVGDYGASTLDVDTVVAVVLADQRLASGFRLLLAASLRDKLRVECKSEGKEELRLVTKVVWPHPPGCPQ